MTPTSPQPQEASLQEELIEVICEAAPLPLKDLVDWNVGTNILSAINQCYEKHGLVLTDVKVDAYQLGISKGLELAQYGCQALNQKEAIENLMKIDGPAILSFSFLPSKEGQQEQKGGVK